MRIRPSFAALAAVLALTLTACTGPAVEDSTAPVTPTQTLSASLDGLSVLDAQGTPTANAAFTDGAGVLALLKDRLGEPTDVIAPEGSPVSNYDWGAVSVLVQQGGPASVTFLAPDFDGYALRTTEGVGVSTPLDDARALGAAEAPNADADGDGSPDALVLGARDVAGTQSQVVAGQVGSQFISLRIENGMVTGLRVPANDFGAI